jgi:hypothetical protein
MRKRSFLTAAAVAVIATLLAAVQPLAASPIAVPSGASTAGLTAEQVSRLQTAAGWVAEIRPYIHLAEGVAQVDPAIDADPTVATPAKALARETVSRLNALPAAERLALAADRASALPGPVTAGPQAAATAAAQRCRAEIAPAIIMGGFIPMGIRVGLNWCIITRLMDGLVAVSWLTTVIAPFLPPPFGFIAGQIANYIVRNAQTLHIVGLGCGYWTYAYLLWAPPAAWISCRRWPY